MVPPSSSRAVLYLISTTTEDKHKQHRYDYNHDSPNNYGNQHTADMWAGGGITSAGIFRAKDDEAVSLTIDGYAVCSRLVFGDGELNRLSGARASLNMWAGPSPSSTRGSESRTISTGRAGAGLVSSS